MKRAAEDTAGEGTGILSPKFFLVWCLVGGPFGSIWLDLEFHLDHFGFRKNDSHVGLLSLDMCL